jgi:predicted amidophosphoribosyltransferase
MNGATPFLPADRRSEATVFTCALCGTRFTHGGLVCSGCVLSNACDLVKCPQCGYQFPRDSRLVAWVRRLLRHRRGREEAR